MREIKFRAFDIVDGTWLHDFQVMSNGAIRIKKPQEDNIERLEWQLTWHMIELMQFTGLNDREGMEIYENDLVIIDDTNTGIVEWKNAGFAITSDDFKGFEIVKDIGRLRVIGNIHDNSELAA
jgi:uncharacterized phage protein (TIGR01671 family)